MENKLSRRSAIQRVSYLVGGAVATPALFSVLQSCQQSVQPLDWVPQFLDEEQSRLVTTLAEMIIPHTNTPGAIDAGVPSFIDRILGECLATEAQSMFTDGLSKLQSLAQKEYDSSFNKLNSKAQTELLNQIANEENVPGNQSGDDSSGPKTFFNQLKQLTLLGYFNSEMGATQALEYVQIPGSYQGCTTLEPGQKAWAV